MNTLKLSRSSKISRYAFTLIELLTVIAIIGILASILIPVVGRVRESAQVAVCQNNLRQLGMGIQLYAADHDGLTPPNVDPGDGVRKNLEGTYIGTASDTRTLGWLIPERIGGPSQNDYIDTIGVMSCPSLDDAVYAADPARYKRIETISRDNPMIGTGYAWIYRVKAPGVFQNIANDKTTYENQNVPYAFDFGWAKGAGRPEIGIPSHESVINVLYVGGHVVSFPIALLNEKASGWSNIYRYLAYDPALYP